MRETIADAIISMRIPGWAAHIGQKWRPYDQAPFNLYNVLWLIQNRLARRVYPY